MAVLVLPILCMILGGGVGFARATMTLETVPDAFGMGVRTSAACSGTECEDHTERVLADIDGDGSVDARDVVLLLADMGLKGPRAADVNDDGEVDADDLTALVRRLGS